MTQALAIVLVVVSACGGFALWWMDGKVEAANARAAQAVEDRGKEEQSRKGFEAAATSCGESVGKLLASAVKQKKDYEARLKESRAETAEAEAIRDQILARARPDGMSECDATFQELNNEIDRRAPKASAFDDRHPHAS